MLAHAVWPCLAALAYLASSARGELELPMSVLRERLNAGVPELLRNSSVDGASIGIVVGGERLITAYGEASTTINAPYTPDTVSQQGSTSKTLTAWAVMQLVERAAASLDDPVGQHISWVIPCAADADADADADANCTAARAGVTLRRLLSHTAGLGLHGFAGFVAAVPGTAAALDAQKDGCCLDEGTWVPGAGDTRVLAPPGSGWRYSGGGYHVLQLLLEEAYGDDFAEIMRRRVLSPLGMNASVYWAAPRKQEPACAAAAAPLPSALAESRCVGGADMDYCKYLTDDRGRLPNYLFSAASAAGLYSTARDFVAFIEAHMGPNAGAGVLSPRSIDAMLSPAPSSSTGYSLWGLGYELQAVNVSVRGSAAAAAAAAAAGGSAAAKTHLQEATLAGHGGSNIGWKLEFGLVREHGIGYTVHTNGENGQAVCDGVRQIFLDWAAGRNATTTASTTRRVRFAEHAKRSTLPRARARNGTGQY